MAQNYRELPGIEPDHDGTTIRANYHSLAKSHLDNNPGSENTFTENFRAMQIAFDTLTDSCERQKCDTTIPGFIPKTVKVVRFNVPEDEKDLGQESATRLIDENRKDILRRKFQQKALNKAVQQGKTRAILNRKVDKTEDHTRNFKVSQEKSKIYLGKEQPAREINSSSDDSGCAPENEDERRALKRKQQKEKELAKKIQDNLAFAAGLVRRQQRKAKLAAKNKEEKRVAEYLRQNGIPTPDIIPEARKDEPLLVPGKETQFVTYNTPHEAEAMLREQQHREDMLLSPAYHQQNQAVEAPEPDNEICKPFHCDAAYFDLCIQDLKKQYLRTRTVKNNHIKVKKWVEELADLKRLEEQNDSVKELSHSIEATMDRIMARTYGLDLEDPDFDHLVAWLEMLVQDPVPDEEVQA